MLREGKGDTNGNAPTQEPSCEQLGWAHQKDVFQNLVLVTKSALQHLRCQRYGVASSLSACKLFRSDFGHSRGQDE